MAQPFHRKTLKAPAVFERMLGRKPRRNGLIAINNLLASADSVEDVSLCQAEEAAGAYGLSIGAHLRAERLAMASAFLNHCLADRRLDDLELAQLRHLRSLIGLRETDVAAIQDCAVRALYERGVDEVLEDRRLDESERERLERLAEDLRLSDACAAGIYASKAREIVQAAIDVAIDDDRLSPAEDAELASLARDLGVDLTPDDELRRTLERFRIYWQIDEGRLSEVDVDIELQASERCYMKVDAEWFEHRRVTRPFGFHAPTAQMKIVEGVYWRASSMAGAPMTEDVMKPIDGGTCYVTNQRLLLHGRRGDKSIPLRRIVYVESHADGVEVERDRGENRFLRFDRGTDLFGLLLDRAIDDCS